MSLKRSLPILALAGAAVALTACATFQRGPVGNTAVPQPAQAVDLNRYDGLWYEIGRYENGFERGCEGVTARYVVRDDGLVGILNSCRQGGLNGDEKTVEGKAKIVEGSRNAKLKVSHILRKTPHWDRRWLVVTINLELIFVGHVLLRWPSWLEQLNNPYPSMSSTRQNRTRSNPRQPRATLRSQSVLILVGGGVRRSSGPGLADLLHDDHSY